MSSKREKRYCAFCGTKHTVYLKRHIAGFDFTLLMLLAMTISWLIWQTLDPRGVAFVMVFLAFAEIFVQIRHRFSLICRECGFDPVLYKRDRERCVEVVKQRLEKRKDYPLASLRPLSLPFRPQNHLPVSTKVSRLSVSE